ncbi:MAG: acyltransferase domain-containing protein, partial [bacterium]|nr:acyltransferase domain-containing protein [bacterium]
MKESSKHSYTGLEIAVIGMAARFPGAGNIDEYWNNLKNGKETTSFFTDDELESRGVSPRLLNDPNYVKAGSIIDNVEYFDANFFGYSPKEAQIMNPQIRIFYQCAYEALENAGYVPYSYTGLIGVYAGASANNHWEALTVFSGKSDELGRMGSMTLANKDSLSTRIAYKLNLKGPAITLRTACSTSMVAIHLACRALLTNECNIALAGGVSIQNLQKTGYFYQEGLTASPDGHCRSFDARARGALFGDGAGVVVLKKLKNAIDDNDHIYAVVKGSAINNDGLQKVGFTAPSVEGQAGVIKAAQKVAGVKPESVQYVETHGSATRIGDTIEIEALKSAFKTNGKKYCGLGSVKSNFGHLDAAAGVAGFIKTALAINYELIPPSLHFESPNPEIDFDNSPFYMVTQLTKWQKHEYYPLRAGVSSFGFGGTNASVIMEKAPAKSDSSKGRDWSLLLFSAKTKDALDRTVQNFIDRFKSQPGISLPDAAYTLQVGRATFKYKKMTLCRTIDEAVENLSSQDLSQSPSSNVGVDRRPVFFMFSGLGAQYVNMGLDLYREEPQFQEQLDRCFDILKPMVDYDVKEVLYPSAAARKDLPDIHRAEVSQVVTFIFEYALAKLIMAWGVKPDAMIGYSFGEYVAACIAGVFSLEDALSLVVARGRLIQAMPEGAMLSVPLPLEEITPLLNPELSLAIDNGPSSVVAGEIEQIDAFERSMKERKLLCVRVSASRAIHSHMMEPAAAEFKKNIAALSPNKPQIPYLSNVTGDWITAEGASSPEHWAAHLTQSVHYSSGMEKLVKEKNALYIEIGAGQDLTAMALRYIDKNSLQKAINLVRPAMKKVSDSYFLWNRIGRLWLNGVLFDWKQMYMGGKRFRVPLPTYSFDNKRYWIDEDPFRQIAQLKELDAKAAAAEQESLYTPTWKLSALPVFKMRPRENQANLHWLFFADESSFTSRLVHHLRVAGASVVSVKVGKGFEKIDPFNYMIDPSDTEDYKTLWEMLATDEKMPRTIVHLWSLTGVNHEGPEWKYVEQTMVPGFNSLLHLARTLDPYRNNNEESVHLKIITANVQEMPGEVTGNPENSIILTALNVIPGHCSDIFCTAVDISIPQPGSWQEERLITQLLVEFEQDSNGSIVAYRGQSRLVRSFETIPASPVIGHKALTRLKQDAVYLISAGMGHMGFEITHHLAVNAKLKLVVIDDGGDTEGMSFTPRITTTLKEEETFLNQAEAELNDRLQIKGIHTYDGLEEEINRFCTSTILEYFRENGVDVGIGSRYKIDSLKEMMKILPKFDKFFGFFLTVLADDQMIDISGDGIVFSKHAQEIRLPSHLMKETQEKYPQFKGILKLVAHCKSNYRKALSGEIEAIGVVYPEGDHILFKEEYQVPANYRYAPLYLELLKELVADILKKQSGGSKDRKIRILEVGGGKGLLTNVLLPILEGHNVEYHFTDIGSFFLIRARQEAAKLGINFMKFSLLDISKDPVSQGYEENSFDIILAMDVVHATPSVESTLKNLKQLLSANGMLCLVELTNLKRWLHMVFGLIEGWWYFEDTEIRTGSPLLEMDAWENLLKNMNFQDVAGFPQEKIIRNNSDCGLIIAQQGNDIRFHPKQEYSGAPRWKQLEKDGAEVRIIQADEMRPEEIEPAIAGVEEEWGPVTGLIHGTENADPVFDDQVKRLLVLDKFFKDKPLDFFILYSALAPMGAAGPLAVFFDSFARYKQSTSGSPVVSAHWAPGVSIDMESILNTILEPLFPIAPVISAGRLPVYSTPDKQAVQTTKQELPGNSDRGVDEGDPEYQRAELNNPYVAPATPTEKKLAGIWQDFLGISQVGIEDDFLELGADSLVFITIASIIHKALHVNIPIPVFFTQSNTGELARYVDEAKRDRYSSIEPMEKRDYYTLSSAQKRILLVTRMEPGSISYNIPISLKVEGEIDKAEFERTLNKLALMHENLRSSFSFRGEIPVQYIHEDVKLDIDYSTAVVGANDEEFRGIIKRLIRPFDLSKPPLLRMALIKIGERKHILLVDMHHIVSDGVSLAIFVQDFTALYTGRELSPLKLQYQDYVRWQNEIINTDGYSEMESFWLDQFLRGDELPVLDLPTDFPRPGVQSFEGGRLFFEISQQETVQIRALAVKLGTTVFMVLLAAYYVMLYKLTNQESTIVGTVVAGRRHAELERIIGPFINTIVLINFPEEHIPFSRFAEGISERTLAAFENQDYPFELLLEKLGVDRDVSRNPLFDTMFVMENFEKGDIQMTGLSFERLEYENPTTHVDLTLVAIEAPKNLGFSFEYCVKLFKKVTIRTFADYMKKIIETIIEHPDLPLAQF